MSTIPKVGDRVRMDGVMPNDPCPLEMGTTGTVTGVGDQIGGRTQIFVEWDVRRSLILLDTDPFEILEPKAPHDCGLCDRALKFAGMEGIYRTWRCEACDWWHISKDCCHEHDRETT